jgi:hypothetical protein
MNHGWDRDRIFFIVIEGERNLKLIIPFITVKLVIHTLLKYFSLCGDASKNYKLITLIFTDSFLFIISTSTDFTYIEFVRYNLKLLHHVMFVNFTCTELLIAIKLKAKCRCWPVQGLFFCNDGVFSFFFFTAHNYTFSWSLWWLSWINYKASIFHLNTLTRSTVRFLPLLYLM